MKKIPMYIESKNGHDVLNVSANEVQKEAEKHLKGGKWVTTQKENGSTEILTEQDIPRADSIKTLTGNTATTPKPNQEWANKFQKINSVTITSKAKGG